MAVFARPISDIARGSWVTGSGGTANLWAQIDEEVADDADLIASALANNSVYECLLSSVPPAVIPRDHIVGIRGHKDASGGNTKGVLVSLVQGTTVLGSLDFPSLPATVTQQNVAIPRAMAAQITDYADLRIRFTPTGITTGGDNRRRVVITGVALRVPAAVDLVDDLLVRWGVTVDQSGGPWQVSHSGFVGNGETLARAVWELFQAMRNDSAFYALHRDEIERRFAIAYGLWKVIEYERIRAEIVAGTYPLPPHQTLQSALAKVDQKILNFIAQAKTADASEGD